MAESYSLSNQALHDLQDIWLYIATNNPTAADKVEADLYKTFDKLTQHPNIGHKRSDLTDKPVLFWNIHTYQVVYTYTEKSLYILRILSGYRDITHIL